VSAFRLALPLEIKSGEFAAQRVICDEKICTGDAGVPQRFLRIEEMSTSALNPCNSSNHAGGGPAHHPLPPQCACPRTTISLVIAVPDAVDWHWFMHAYGH